MTRPNEEITDPKIIAAITSALSVYLAEDSYETPAPPYIIAPSVLASQVSPWRFVGRQESMQMRSMVQMKSMRW